MELRKEKSQGRFLFLTQDITVYFLSTPWKKPIGSSSIIFYKDYIRFQKPSIIISGYRPLCSVPFLTNGLVFVTLCFWYDHWVEEESPGLKIMEGLFTRRWPRFSFLACPSSCPHFLWRWCPNNLHPLGTDEASRKCYFVHLQNIMHTLFHTWPHIQSYVGNTPLHYASMQKKLTVVSKILGRELLEKRATNSQLMAP